MNIKSFGTILIGLGVFGIFAISAFSEWNVQLDFLGNLRYAKLIELTPSYYSFGKYTEAEVLTLGQGILLPLFLIGIGFVFNREIIEPKFIIKWLPFLK